MTYSYHATLIVGLSFKMLQMSFIKNMLMFYHPKIRRFASNVSSRLSNIRLSTLHYGLVYGNHNQEDPVKCAKTRVIITHLSDQPLR